MNSPHRLTMTAEEYLAWEARQERKHELVGGVVKLMAGGTVAHFQIVRNLVVGLHGRLRGKPCQVLPEGVKVKSPTGNLRYPDVLVDCGRPQPSDLFADQPSVLVEVLSPSTEWFDETDKLEEYRSIASVRHVVLLSQRRAFGRVWTRDGAGWTTRDADGMDAALDLALIGLSVPLAEVYEAVEFAPLDEG